MGHNVDKVEFIVMGGTFMSLPEDYRDYFIRNLHDALSGHTSSNVQEAVKYVLYNVIIFNSDQAVLLMFVICPKILGKE